MRYRLLLLDRRQVLSEEFYPTLAAVRARVNAIRREQPDFIKNRDIWVEDTRDGIEYSVDQQYNLIEM